MVTSKRCTSGSKQRCRSVFNIGGYTYKLSLFLWFSGFRGYLLIWNIQNSEILGEYIPPSSSFGTPLSKLLKELLMSYSTDPGLGRCTVVGRLISRTSYFVFMICEGFAPPESCLSEYAWVTCLFTCFGICLALPIVPHSVTIAIPMCTRCAAFTPSHVTYPVSRDLSCITWLIPYHVVHSLVKYTRQLMSRIFCKHSVYCHRKISTNVNSPIKNISVRYDAVIFSGTSANQGSLCWISANEVHFWGKSLIQGA